MQFFSILNHTTAAHTHSFGPIRTAWTMGMVDWKMLASMVIAVDSKDNHVGDDMGDCESDGGGNE